MCGSRIYRVWWEIKGRCVRKTHARFKDYGGRGIVVCDKWLAFSGFFEDMGKGYKHGLQIDRIDNNSGYYKENCRWTTPLENNRNKRNNHWIVCGGRRQTLSEWSRELGIHAETICSRINKLGWEIERALFTKPKA